MAFVLKEPNGNSKGILIFTHKEQPMISASVPGMSKLMQKLKARYVLGMHFGWNMPGFKDADFIDFFLAAPDCLTLPPENKKRHIPLASRNFVPESFRPRPEQPKEWDVICVAHSARFKCLDEFLIVMKGLMDRRPGTRVLLLANEPENPDPRHYYTELLDDYQRLFTDEQKDNFDLLILKRRDDLYAIKHHSMPFFYNASRVFTLFTTEEGNARAIGEAQLCGLPVVCKSYLKGAGRANLNDYNSRQFNDLDDAVEKFLDVLEKPPDMTGEVEKLAQDIREDYSIPKLDAALRSLFEELGVSFDGQLDYSNLIRKFSSHRRTLPRHLTHQNTDDLKSARAATIYLQGLMDEEPQNALSAFLLTIYDGFRAGYKKLRSVASYGKYLLNAKQNKTKNA